jgi:hypothetical protein
MNGVRRSYYLRSPHVGYSQRVAWQTTDDLLAWLDELSPADAVRVSRLLADTKTAGALRVYADRVVYDMTRVGTYNEVAEALGSTRKQIMKAVERQNARSAS